MLTSLCEFLNNCFEWFSLDDNFSAVVDVTRSALLLDEWLFCDAYLRRSVPFCSVPSGRGPAYSEPMR